MVIGETERKGASKNDYGGLLFVVKLQLELHIRVEKSCRGEGGRKGSGHAM